MQNDNYSKKINSKRNMKPSRPQKMREWDTGPGGCPDPVSTHQMNETE